jgi:hypothetical protein
MGQRERTTECGAARQRVRAQRAAQLREVQVGMAAAAKDCARSRTWEAHAAATAALTGQTAGQGAASDPGQKRLLELNAQAVDSILGFGTLAPGARLQLQHELTAEVECAKHRALWVWARAVWPPGNDATTWHAAENAEYLKAYAAKAAFECAYGISRTMPTAWPGTDTSLDNGQFQAFTAAHLGLGDPELSTHVGASIEAPNRTGTGWRKISDAMDCRATDLYTASFLGKAGPSRWHDGLRDRIYREVIRAGLLAHREYAPAVMRGLTGDQRKALDAASAAALRAPLRSWECCAAPRGSTGRRQCPCDKPRPASPLTGARGGVHAYRGEVHRLRHKQVLHPMYVT